MNPNPVMMVQKFLHQTVFFKEGRKLMLLFAYSQTVETIYTTTIINSVFFTIDASCFAFGGKKARIHYIWQYQYGL